MSSNDRIKSVNEAEPNFIKMMDTISDLEKQIEYLPDFFEQLTVEQKNRLFHEFERLSMNLGTLSSWLSLPISHKTRLRIAPNLKVMISHEEGSITLKFLEFSKKQD